MIGDFVKAELPYFDVCISNTPYQVRSKKDYALTNRLTVSLRFPHQSSFVSYPIGHFFELLS